MSSIFKWFHEDFERAAGTLPAFVACYADEPAATALRAGCVRLDFLEYDWSLNGTEAFSMALPAAPAPADHG